MLVMVVRIAPALTISPSASLRAKVTAAETLNPVTSVAITAQQARADETLSLIRRGDEEIRKQSFYQRIDSMHQQLDQYMARSDAVDKPDLQSADQLPPRCRQATDRINSYISAGNYPSA